MCECGAIREEREADAVDGGGKALCATGAEDVEALPDVNIVVAVRGRVCGWGTMMTSK